MEPTLDPAAPTPDDLWPDADRLAMLREILGTDELRELYLIFADRASEVAAWLAREPAQPGLEELEIHVHTVKGTAANLGLARVADAADAVLGILRREGPARALQASVELVSLLQRLPGLLTSDVFTRRLSGPT